MSKFWLLPLVLVVGCASKPQVVEIEKPVSVPKAVGFKDVEYLQRNEVIQATKDCINNRLKPVVQYIQQKTEQGTIMLPAVVNWEVYTADKR